MVSLLPKRDPSLLRPESVIGPYVIEAPISQQGGMSELYVARLAASPNRRVALKINRQNNVENSDPANVYQDLLRKEVRLLRELRHPGIVRVYPFTLYPGDNKITYQAKQNVNGEDLWYFAMEYLPAGSLDQKMDAIARMPAEWAVELFYQILVTLQFLHRSGYAHCDLKPSNILLREPPNLHRLPQPVLIDFGCAVRIDQPVKKPCVTPSYSPPEVLLANQRPDLPAEGLQLKPDKIDVWSLGAIFYALLVGKPMFPQKDRREITTNVIRGNVSKLAQSRPDLHASLDVLLMAMMRSHPDDRANLDDIIMALEEKISSMRPPRLPNA